MFACSYRFCDVWGGTNEEATEKVHTFFESSYFLEDLEPLDGAAAALERLSAKFRMVVVTSRQHCIAEATMQWVEKHFPGKFQKVYFGNHWARDCPDPEKMNSSKRTKLQMCQEAGAIALIDDSASYAKECGPSLNKVGTMPHAKHSTLTTLVNAGGAFW
jgi:hypothetical protein